MTDLQIAKGFSLPLDMVTEATAIVATRGAGKSSTGAVLVEEAFAAGVQTVVTDYTGVFWGLRSNAAGTGPGLGIYVLGGQHGDVPLESSGGVLIADLVVDSGHSFVLDLSDFTKGQMRRFCADFLERLYERKARARTTLLLVIDEAHEMAPQSPRGGFKGDAARLIGAMEQVVALGRSRGIGVVLITQRTQALNKAVLDLIETLMAMRMLSPRAVAAVRDWIVVKNEDDDHGVLSSLVDLPTGTAWVWSPLRGILKKIAVRRIKTFDSYATPQPGETRVEPQAKTELDLASLGEQMAATVERAKENDPAALRRRIRELEQTVEASRALPAEVVEARVEVPVFPEPLRAAILREYEAIAASVTAAAESAQAALAHARERLEQDFGLALEILSVRPAAVSAPPPARPSPSPAPPARSDPSAENGNGLGRKAERMVLAVLAQYPDGRTKRQTAVLAGYAVKGGGFNGALSKLRTLGYIDGSESIRITTEGLQAIDGQWEPLPTGRALLDHWLGTLSRRAEREVLQALYDAYPDSLTKDETAARSGYEVAGGGFNGALSKLRTLELIEGSGQLRANGDLFA